MGRYYYLIAGLPDIGADDGKLPFSLSAFRREMESQLTPPDKRLTDLFYIKFDNGNLLSALSPEKPWDERGDIAAETFEELLEALRGENEDVGKFLARHESFPRYMVDFLRQHLEETADGKADPAAPLSDDRLAAHYYAHAMTCRNAFVSGWFELNLNIRNLLSAFTARKYGMESAAFVVGDNDVAHALRTSHARDFGLGDAVDYLPVLQRIAEEPDLYVREKKLDQLKWEWLEEQTFFLTFGIESVFAYLCKLEILERWTALDKAVGEQTFRSLVGTMKKGGSLALSDFRKAAKP
jgi:hypothetical protein